MTNGYVVVECDGLDLTKGSTEQTKTGLYKKVKDAIKTGKPILASGCVWGSESAISPIYVFTVEFDGYVICTASTLQVVITDEDVVTIVNMAPSQEA